MPTIIKTVSDLQPGDQCVERDGALLTVEAIDRVGRDVVITWGWLGSACPPPARFRGTKRVHVFAEEEKRRQITDATIIRIVDVDSGEEEWRGEWCEFESANAEVDIDEIIDVTIGLRDEGVAHMGGGAQPLVRIEVVS